MNEQTDSAFQRARVIDQKTAATSRVSDTSRVVGFGLMLVYFTIMISDGDTAKALRDSWWELLILSLAGIFGVFTVALDYKQYAYAEQSAKIALATPDARYDDESAAYKRQDLCFRAKQWTALLGAGAVLGFMAIHGLNAAIQ